MRWIDRIPLGLLVVIAVILGIAPMNAEPHLVEKSRMLLDGTLVKPIDIFDLLMHATPSVLLLIRLGRMIFKRTNNNDASD